MGRRSIKVGKGFEYRVRDWFRRAGFEANRIPVSGVAPAMRGDVVVRIGEGEELRIECKRRTGGYKELFKWLDEALGKGIDVLVLGVGRQKPIIVMRIDRFVELILRRR